MKPSLLCRLWLACAIGMMSGCGNNPTPGGEDVLGVNPGTSDGGAGDSTGAVNALNYAGSLSGSVSGASSTAASTTGSSSRLASALEVAASSMVWITDLDGNPIRDAQGNEYAPFPVNPDGTFDLTGIPVGVDLVINIDIDGDGTADVKTIVNVPADADGTSGQLTGVIVDPLSTLAYAKLLALLKEAGADPANLGLSLSALIERTRDAFENLSVDSGIDLEITLGEILAMTPEEQSALFDRLIPEGAQRGMRMFRGNIALAVAADVAGVVKAVAPILLEGGFVVADNPGGVDLSALGSLPNVRTISFEQYFQEQRAGETASAQEAGAPPPGFVPPTLYQSTVAEPDRNFASAGETGPTPHRPIIGEEALIHMAEAHLAGKTITLRQLHRLLVDVNAGLAVRLVYPRFWGPNTMPTDVFESADGSGVERHTQELFMQIDQLGLNVPDPQTFQARQSQLRAILANFLNGTAEPSFERLFGGFLMERVPSADAVARYLRTRRAHLPFSRTGPAQVFVVATADSFRDSSAVAVRVSVETDAGGVVQRVRADSAGKFYVTFGPQTDAGMMVGLINATNGRMLHDHKGRPQFVEIADANVFEPVGGESFLEAFSESGSHFPGAPLLSVPNWGFDPNRPEDPQTNPRNFQILVLMTRPGPDAEPVRVHYSGGTATYDPNGAYYAMFDPETMNGYFALIRETGEMLMTTPGDWNTRVLVHVDDIQELPPMDHEFIHVFGINVANPAYDPAGAPYYDDINGNGVEDAGEPTFSERHFLGHPDDWRSTFVEQYYRKASDNGFPSPQDIDFGSDTPRLRNGDPLVPRNFRPRLNAFLFGRPNVAVNLLMAFNPPEFFDGTRALNADTPLNPFTVMALVNLVFESVQNVEGTVDFDGDGPQPPRRELIQAHYFIPPVGDPVQLLVSGFGEMIGKQ